MFKSKINFLVFTLVFGLLAIFLIHNFDSIGQDIGRHLKTGEIIWQTKEIPKTNLFSFTEPDFPFINHHWLSEVIFFGIFNLAGFIGLTLVKVFLALAVFLLLFFTVNPPCATAEASYGGTRSHKASEGPIFLQQRKIGFWPLVISLLFSILIFIQRTEVRPEIFSFAIISFFLFALFRAKYSSRPDPKNPQGRTFGYLWFLPLAQLLWVNLHIYFFIGPFLVLVFLIDRLIASRFDRVSKEWESHSENLGSSERSNLGIKRIVVILFLVFAATLANPNGIQGALLPFNILNEYGYSIVENQTLAFLADFFGFNLPIFIFKLSAVILAVSFFLTVKKAKQRIFEILISIFFIYAGFKMLRNLPLYALVSFPVLAILLTDVFNKLTTNDRNPASFSGSRTSGIFKTTAVVFLVFMIFFVASGSYYKKAGLSREFNFSVPNGLERAISFVKENKIKGPMFNNFDIGGYLIWQLYPQEKVFVDNRPEAYSVKFFTDIYKPMQENKEKWLEYSEKYGINFILFAHTDSTSWGQDFFYNIVKNRDWRIVYINEEVIILVKNDGNNSEVISKLSISRKNAIEKIVRNMESSNADEVDAKLSLSRFLYNINWYEASVYFADEVIKLAPQNSYAYLYKGLAHAYYADKQNQKLAPENIKKAIDLGLKGSQYHSILGIVYMNLGRLESAKESFKEALRLDKNNAQAQEFLNKYFNR